MRFLSSSIASSVRDFSRSVSPKIVFGFIPAVALWAARVSTKRAATEIRKCFPEYRYTVTGEIQTMHNVATCRWGSGMPAQPFHYTGTDFVEERDGRVSRLYTFIDGIAPPLTSSYFSPKRA